MNNFERTGNLQPSSVEGQQDGNNVPIEDDTARRYGHLFPDGIPEGMVLRVRTIEPVRPEEIRESTGTKHHTLNLNRKIGSGVPKKPRSKH